MLTKLPLFRRRQKQILNELNDMVNRINLLSNLLGDGLINIKQTGAGITVGLNVNVLKGRLAKVDLRTRGITFLARTTEAATANNQITCNLCDSAGDEIESGFGSGITVYCNISGGSALNAAIRRLADDDYLAVYYKSGQWRATEGFQTSEDCVCSS